MTPEQARAPVRAPGAAPQPSSRLRAEEPPPGRRPEEAGERGVRQRAADRAFRGLAVFCAAMILVVMAGLFAELVRNSLPSIRKFGFGFLFSSSWNPVTQEFGALSSVFGSLVSTALAMLLVIPLGLASAIFLVELCPPVLSRYMRYGVELLAAIPSIIYGMWGLFVFAPFMADHVQPALQSALGFLPLFRGPPMGIGMLTAGIILALMVLPFSTSVMRDVIHMVPSVVKEAAHGMGATTWEVTRKVTLPYGIQGIMGGVFLGLGRAIGETMAVTFVIGNTHHISASLFMPGNSITSTLANEFTEASDKIYLSSLIELGLLLFVITLAIQVAAHLWLKRLERTSGARL